MTKLGPGDYRASKIDNLASERRLYEDYYFFISGEQFDPTTANFFTEWVKNVEEEEEGLIEVLARVGK